MATHLQLGQFGEQEAKRYLEAQGYQILATNWRYKHWEVDIIAKDADILVFVEVKSRSSLAFGEPASFVSHKKQQNLIKLANVYLTKSQHLGEIRFDIVSVHIQKNKETNIELIKDAFWNY